MIDLYKESGFENLFINYIENLGYEKLSHHQIKRESEKNPLAIDILQKSLAKINPDLSAGIRDKAIHKLKTIDAGLLVDRNKEFFDYLQNGMEISFYKGDKLKTKRVYLVDFDNIDNNSFIVTSQVTIQGRDRKRPDVLIYLNGMPLVVVELKSMSAQYADVFSAYRQIKNYQNIIEELFVYNAFNIISDYTTTMVGTITASKEWYKEWKSVDGSYESTQTADYKTLLSGLLAKERFLDIIKNFIFFEDNEGRTNKILAQYHQYFAVHKAVDSTIAAIKRGDGRGGVFWHTQGSGKSLSMVFYTAYLMKELEGPTFVILTDRKDLDDQLFSQFAKASKFLRQKPIQAKSRENLRELLADRKSNGIFFSTMQKFAESDEALTQRKDVIVIADEAHRSQYGLREKITKSGKIKIGMARLVRESLPNATYIGFTGTPLSRNDKDTREVFGSYIDIYDMTQAVEDGATKPVFYENRVINLGLDENILKEIDAKYEELAENANEYDIEKSKRDLSRMEQILGSDKAIDTLVRDIVNHYEKFRADLLTGKAMIVAYNRKIAVKIYKKIMELRPSWDEKVHVIVTPSNNDPEEWKDIIGAKSDNKELAKRFKDNDDPFKLAIVVDMWLTGFDLPSLSTLYVYKPMKGHNLMQAIARVNRVFEDKEGGLVVDYIGIASALKKAMADYTEDDKNTIDNANIREKVYPMFQKKLKAIRHDYFEYYFYADIFGEIESERLADLIQGGINHILKYTEEKQNAFKRDAYSLKQTHTLCASLSKDHEQREAAFFEAIRVSINRITSPGELRRVDINKEIGKLLESSIESDGVINLFRDFEKGFSLFDPVFLTKIAKMQGNNLSVKLLEKLLKDEIVLVSKRDVVLGEKFSEKLKKIMKRYHASLIDNADSLDEFIGIVAENDGKSSGVNETRQALIDLAKEVVDLTEENKDLGLSDEEIAFYRAISKPENIEDFFTDEELINLSIELSESIEEQITSDWQKKESGKANMRRTIKRLLREYNYPKDQSNKIIKLLMKQAENIDKENLA